MQCGNQLCGAQIVQLHELFFFKQSDTSVHLALKPELRELVASRRSFLIEKVPHQRIQNVVCSVEKCRATIGKELPYGPNTTSFVAFGLDKVVLSGKRYDLKKVKLRNLVPQLVEIERRDSKQFFSDNLYRSPSAEAAAPIPAGPIRFASIDRMADFEWRDLLLAEPVFGGSRRRPRRRHCRQPRRYQLEAFAEALQRNLVLVMPTGSGKTLVAALLLARMRRLNPHLMGALLVERVPLVFQQARALECDTGLRVAALCGENATDTSVRRLREGSHDLLVATAGLLLSRLLDKRDLNLALFSCIVLDECHHAGTGEHNFSRVLDQLKILPERSRPRLLGLTASPIELRDMDSGEMRLDRFRRRFPDGTEIFRPAEARAQTPNVLEVPVARSPVLNAFLDAARLLLEQRLRSEFNESGGALAAWLADSSTMVRRFGQLLGQLRALRGSPTLRLQGGVGAAADRLKELVALMDVIDVARTLGLSFAVPLVQRELPGLAESLSGWLGSSRSAGWQTDRSERLRALEAELQRLGDTSRALVFVITRRTARMLAECLADSFKQLRPQLCIGQGGPDGMRWEEEQEVALDRFNSGASRLMVSTSVLEEGLDVGECDVVIRFDAARSLIQLVQSRGRARRPGSRFVVIADADEKEAAERLRQREVKLDALLSRDSMEAGGPSPATVAIVQQLVDGQSSDEDEQLDQPTGGTSSAAPGPSIWSFSGRHLVLRLFADLRGSGLKKLVKSLEQPPCCLRVSRVDEFASVGSAAGISAVFPATTSVVVVCIDSGGSAGSAGRGGRGNLPLLRWWHFCRQWSFRHSGCPVYTLPSVPEAATESAGSAADEPRLPLSGVAVGRFERELEIAIAQEFNNGAPQLRCQQAASPREAAQLVVQLYDGQLKIRLATTGTGGFALVDWQLGLLAVPMRFCPDIVVNETTEDEIDSSPAELDAMRFQAEQAECQLLLLRLDEQLLCSSGWLTIRRHFPLPLLETRLTLQLPQEAASVPSLSQLSTIDSPQPSKRPRFSLCDPVLAAEFNCRWLLRVLLDGRRFRLCAESFVRPVHNEILEKSDSGDEIGLLRLAAGLRQLISLPAFLADPAARLETCRHLLKDLPAEKIASLQPVAPPDTVDVLRALVTPSRVVCLPSVPVATSRLLRRWSPEGRRFLLVNFTDEFGNPVRNVEQRDRERFRRVLTDGLLLAGKAFRFLSASGSQLRSQRCLFVDADSQETIAAMRHSLVGDPLAYNSPAKYLARLALFHTGDKPAMNLPLSRVGNAPDRKAANGDFLTDGCGKISRRLADQIAEQLDLSGSPAPSAYQFRYSGAKGVLVVVDPLVDAEFRGCNRDVDILLRPSMEKFKAPNDTELCIVQRARALPVCLNREAITLLEALSHRAFNAGGQGSWDLASGLHEMQEAALARASECLAGGDAARQALQEYIEPYQVSRVSANFDLASEPHWRSLLRLAFQFRVIDLRTRTALPVAQGCRVMGAADPTGQLAEGEVYLRISREDDGRMETVKGRVLIYRNPCLHPGDLRVARAVSDQERPDLAQWVNVLLTPAGANCQTSLPADCSGGDLDGDQFSVIWDPNLVPPDSALHPALNYAKLAANPPTVPPGTDVSDPDRLAEFYLANLENTFLGRVAHMHLALCDQLVNGAVDPLARKLAESQSVAVDFPKTGIVPQVPKDALDAVSKHGYPDFMEKPKESTYQSEKLLGQLYRRCRTYALDWDLLEQATATPASTAADSCCRPTLAWPGWEAFAGKARIELAHYRLDLRALLGQWGLASERELALARCVSWHSTLRADLGAAQRNLRGVRDALFSRYRREFESDPDLAGRGADAQRAKAAAWYLVSTEDARRQSDSAAGFDVDLDDDPDAESVDGQRTGRRCLPLGLSFPWVVADILCDIRQNLAAGRDGTSNAERNLRLDIGRSAVASFRESLPALIEAVGRAESAAALVASAIHQTVAAQRLAVSVYGSASVFLCDSVNSDVDLCVLDTAPPPPQLASLTATELQRHWLRNVVSPALDQVATAKEDLLNDNRNVLLIRCILTVDGDDSVACDISMNSVGPEKTRYLLDLYSAWPHRLPLLRQLIDWARAAGIVRSAEDDEDNPDEVDIDGERRMKMPTAEFYALALHCLQLEVDSSAGSSEQPGQSLASQLAAVADQLRLPDAIADADAAAALGARIIGFYRTCAGLDGHVTYRWPIPSGQTVTIAAGAVRYAAKCARAALLRLYYARDVALVTVAAATDLRGGPDVGAGACARFAKTLPHRLSQELARVPGFHEARLAAATGCVRVRLTEVADRPPLLRLTAEGSANAVARLRREVRQMAGAAGWLLRSCHRRRACRYFMDGASLLLGANCLSDECRFSLASCVSGVVGEHRLKPASLLKCARPDCPDRDTWLRAASRRLFQVMARQLCSLSPARPDLISSLEVTVRPGQFYVLNADEALPATQCSLSLAETAAYVAKGQKYRKNVDRQSFEPPTSKQPTERDCVDQVAMVPLTAGGKRNDNSVKPGRTQPEPPPSVKAAKSARRNRRLGCGFMCGLYRLQSAEAAGSSTAERLRRRQPALVAEGDAAIFCSALLQLGFSETAAPIAVPDRQGHNVKVSVRVSASYEASLFYNASLQLGRVEERPLNWIHATVLDTDSADSADTHGGGVDMRIAVSTAAPVAAGSGIYRSLFAHSTEAFAYIRDAPGGRIRVSERVPQAMRDRIVGIRHRRSARWFYLPDDIGSGGGVDACLAEGDYYPTSGPDCDPFVDLSIHFPPDCILQQQEQQQQQQLTLLAESAQRIVTLSDRLRMALKAASAAAAARCR